jgi:hypothetical protein
MRPLGTVLAPEPCFRELHFASGVVLQLGMRIEDGEKVDPYNFTVLKRLVFVFGGDPADLATIPSFEPHKEATK